MDKSFAKRSETMDPFDLDKIGKDLNISSIGEEMRLLECPKCHRYFIRHLRKEIQYAKCVCGIRIKLKKRWYD